MIKELNEKLDMLNEDAGKILAKHGWGVYKETPDHTFYEHPDRKFSRTHSIRVSKDGKIRHIQYSGWTGFAYTSADHKDIEPKNFSKYMKSLHK